MSAPSEELVEEVAADGTVLRVVTRRQMRRDRLRHRCVFVIVERSTGEVLVQRRSPHKDLWPSRWDIGAGGVVGAGEPWLVAAERELAEELGIVGAGLVHVADACYDDADVSEVGSIFRVVWDGPVELVDGEVVEVRWLTRRELATMVAGSPFVPDVVALVLPHLGIGTR